MAYHLHGPPQALDGPSADPPRPVPPQNDETFVHCYAIFWLINSFPQTHHGSSKTPPQSPPQSPPRTLPTFPRILYISSRGLKKSNLKVTGEEKPKMRLRRRKANKRLCREKSQFAPSQTKKSQFHLSQTKKKPVCAIPERKMPTADISCEKNACKF